MVLFHQLNVKMIKFTVLTADVKYNARLKATAVRV